MIKLKPCPFCGVEPKLKIRGREDPRYDDSFVEIVCTNCLAYMDAMPSNPENLNVIVNKWNRRV